MELLEKFCALFLVLAVVCFGLNFAFDPENMMDSEVLQLGSMFQTRSSDYVYNQYFVFYYETESGSDRYDVTDDRYVANFSIEERLDKIYFAIQDVVSWRSVGLFDYLRLRVTNLNAGILQPLYYGNEADTISKMMLLLDYYNDAVAINSDSTTVTYDPETGVYTQVIHYRFSHMMAKAYKYKGSDGEGIFSYRYDPNDPANAAHYEEYLREYELNIYGILKAYDDGELARIPNFFF